MVGISDTVLIKDAAHGYLPAMVVTVFDVVKGETYPDVALVVFVTGYHACAYEERRVKHHTSSPKRKVNQRGEDKLYITKKELRTQQKNEEANVATLQKMHEALSSLVSEDEEEDQAKAE